MWLVVRNDRWPRVSGRLRSSNHFPNYSLEGVLSKHWILVGQFRNNPGLADLLASALGDRDAFAPRVLRFPLLPGLPPPGSWPGSIVGASCVHPKGARQCFPFSGEGRKRMLPRGASSIRAVFLVLARHERRSRCCGVDRSQKTNGFDTPVYGSAFGERA